MAHADGLLEIPWHSELTLMIMLVVWEAEKKGKKSRAPPPQKKNQGK